MAEFSSMSSSDQSIPFAGSSTDENALGLTNPDSVLTGTNRGQQALGAPNIKTDSGNQRIVVNDNTTNRVSFGRIGTGVNDWGLKVSKPTFNVDTATSDQLIFNSSQNVFKIVSTGTGTVFGKDNSASALWATFTEGTNQLTIAHGLAYTPIMLCYVTSSSGSSYPSNSYKATPAPLIFQAALAFPWQDFVDSYVDSTNIYVRYNICPSNNASARSATFKYYLLQESIA